MLSGNAMLSIQLLKELNVWVFFNFTTVTGHKTDKTEHVTIWNNILRLTGYKVTLVSQTLRESIQHLISEVELVNRHHTYLHVQTGQRLYGGGIMWHWDKKGPQILNKSLFFILFLCRHSLSICITDNISLSHCLTEGGWVVFQARRMSLLATSIARCRAACQSNDNSIVTVEQRKIASHDRAECLLNRLLRATWRSPSRNYVV